MQEEEDDDDYDDDDEEEDEDEDEEDEEEEEEEDEEEEVNMAFLNLVDKVPHWPWCYGGGLVSHVFQPNVGYFRCKGCHVLKKKMTCCKFSELNCLLQNQQRVFKLVPPLTEGMADDVSCLTIMCGADI